jgi:hypothetical protein
MRDFERQCVGLAGVMGEFVMMLLMMLLMMLMLMLMMMMMLMRYASERSI